MDEENLTPNQLDVVRKLYPRVQLLKAKGLTTAQVIDTLVVSEGWPIAAVALAVERVKRAGSTQSKPSP
jgi:hypothetical protein